MAKKKQKSVQNVQPSKIKKTQASQHPQQSSNQAKSNMISRLIGCVCLLAFIFFEELWVGTLTCALAFTTFFVIQVFVEKSREWYASVNLYGAVFCFVLAYLEFQYHIISNLMGI